MALYHDLEDFSRFRDFLRFKPEISIFNSIFLMFWGVIIQLFPIQKSSYVSIYRKHFFKSYSEMDLPQSKNSFITNTEDRGKHILFKTFKSLGQDKKMFSKIEIAK